MSIYKKAEVVYAKGKVTQLDPVEGFKYRFRYTPNDPDEFLCVELEQEVNSPLQFIKFIHDIVIKLA